jgi:hypothetical protein
MQPNLLVFRGVENLSLWDPAPEGATAPLDAQQLRWDSKTKKNF